MNMRRRKVIASLLFVVAVGAVAWWYFRPGGPAATPSHADYPVRGLDISSHNGDIDFNQVISDSISFVIIKATEGSAFKDPNFHHNYLQASRSGLRVGAYHFFRFDAPGYMQALNFLHSVRGKHFDLPLVIDIEEWTNPTDRPTAAIVAQLRVLIDRLEQSGYRVMLYTNKDGYDRFIAANFGKYPIWIASLRGNPDMEWTMWQYTHHGSAKGVPSNVDINTFNGTESDFASWLEAMEN